MSRLVWFIAWAGVALWSLACAAAYGLINLFGGFAASNADWVSPDPDTVEFVNWLMLTAQSLGLASVVVIWAIVSLGILATAWLVTRLIGPPAPSYRLPRL